MEAITMSFSTFRMSKKIDNTPRGQVLKANVFRYFNNESGNQWLYSPLQN